MGINVPPILTKEEIDEINQKNKEEAQKSAQKLIEYKLAVERREQILLPRAKKCIAEILGLQTNLGRAFSISEIREAFDDKEGEPAITDAIQYFKENPNNPEKIKYITKSYEVNYGNSKNWDKDLEYDDWQTHSIDYYYKEYTKSELLSPEPVKPPTPVPKPKYEEETQSRSVINLEILKSRIDELPWKAIRTIILILFTLVIIIFWISNQS